MLPTHRQVKAPHRAGLIFALLLSTLLPAGAQAAGTPYAPYDGSNPFNCTIQDVGTGTDFPDPGADPFCVEFDKTQQNVTDFGIADFLSQEPARLAAAPAKCFYYQRDHWTGSIVQGSQPEVYHWDGGYFFNKASGNGGAAATNLRVGGQPLDGTPYAPPDFQPYMAVGGGGGALIANEVDADPTCVALVNTPEKRAQIYFHRMQAGKILRRSIGVASIGSARATFAQTNGPPHGVLGRSDRYEVDGGGELRLAYRKARIAAVLTTSPSYTRHRLKVGDPAKPVIAKWRGRFVRKTGPDRVYEGRPSKAGRLFFGIKKGHVRWAAIVSPALVKSDRGARRTLNSLAFGPPIKR